MSRWAVTGLLDIRSCARIGGGSAGAARGAPDDEEAARESIAALDRLVEHELDHGTPERALVAAEEHTQLERGSLARAPGDPARPRWLSLSLRTLGDVQRERKAWDEALAAHERDDDDAALAAHGESLQIVRGVPAREPDQPRWLEALASDLHNLGAGQREQEQPRVQVARTAGPRPRGR